MVGWDYFYINNSQFKNKKLYQFNCFLEINYALFFSFKKLKRKGGNPTS